MPTATKAACSKHKWQSSILEVELGCTTKAEFIKHPCWVAIGQANSGSSYSTCCEVICQDVFTNSTLRRSSSAALQHRSAGVRRVAGEWST